MKKFLFIMTIAGFALMTFGGSPAVAGGDADALIKLLVKKGILTSREAESLATEMKQADEKEKKAIKEVVKQEVEKHPVELPKCLKDIKVGGTYFLEYYRTEPDDDDGHGSFRIQRAYFTIKKKFAPWFETRLTSDIKYDSDTDDWKLRIKYAYGKFSFKKLGGSDVNLASEVGLVHTASDDYDASLWPYRCQGKNYLDRHKILSSSDFGANMKVELGSMDKDFKKKISKKWAAKWGGVRGGIYNGPGYAHSEKNDNNLYEIFAYIRPLNMIPALEGLRFAYHILRGESEGELTPGLGDYSDFEVNQIMGSYQHNYFTIMGRLYEGKSTHRAGDANDRDGYNIAAVVKMPFDKRIRAFARLDVYDANDDISNYDEETLIYGLSFDLLKGLVIWTGIEEKGYEKARNQADSDTYQVGLAISF